MSGIRLWRCSRCCEQAAVVAVDSTRLFCGECFYRQTVERRLDRLTIAARGAENLMPLILDAAEAYATVGEISDRLRTVFGEYREAA